MILMMTSTIIPTKIPTTLATATAMPSDYWLIRRYINHEYDLYSGLNRSGAIGIKSTVLYTHSYENAPFRAVAKSSGQIGFWTVKGACPTCTQLNRLPYLL